MKRFTSITSLTNIDSSFVQSPHVLFSAALKGLFTLKALF